ncbi:hypothetical protein H0H93_010797 [Arthromyces matolae]|nr:hypothetical protein H0H93_010797 [Arthromyces matolae]
MQAVDRRGKAPKYRNDVMEILPAKKKQRQVGGQKETYYKNVRYITGSMALSVSPEVKDGQSEATMAVLQTAALIAKIVMLYPEETPGQIKTRVHACQDRTGKCVLKFPLSQKVFESMTRSGHEMDGAISLLYLSQSVTHLGVPSGRSS